MIQAPAQLNSAMIQRAFGRLLAAHGESLARLGLVEIKSQSPLNHSDTELDAEVLDGRKTPFQVQLYYQPQEEWVLSGDCSCAAANDCKHCAAVAFAWLEARPAPAADEQALQSWLKELAQSTAPPPKQPPDAAAAQIQIAYVLDSARRPPHSLKLSVVLARKARGQQRWRATRDLKVSELPKLAVARAEDREFARLLSSMHPVGATELRDLPLKGRAGLWLLQELLQLRRCFWKNLESPPLVWGAPQALELDWKALPTGYQLQPQLEGELYLLAQQALYLDSASGTLGPIEHGGQDLRALLNAPVVSKQALPRLSRALLQHLPEAPLPEPLKQQSRRIQLQPRAQLLLYAQQHAGPFRVQDLRAQLQFLYGDEIVPAHPQHTQETRFQGSEIVQIQRDLNGENQALKKLQHTGMYRLKDESNAWSLPADQPLLHALGGGETLLLNWHHWLQNARPELEAQGWNCILDPSFEIRFLRSGLWQAECQESDSPHIFDVKLGVEIEGEQLDLLPVLIQMLKSVPDPQAIRRELERHESWLLPIPKDPIQDWAAQSQFQHLPQRWLEVPSRRLARILDLLVELFDFLPEAPQLHESALLQLQTQRQHHPDDYGLSWRIPREIEEKAQALKQLPAQVDALNFTHFQGQLRPYQQEGVAWAVGLAELGLNGILADDMGLGKTLQTLALLNHEKNQGTLKAPALVVMPTSVLPNWEREAARFTPQLRCVTLYGPERNLQAIQGADLVLTTYSLYRRDQRQHQQQRYRWLILDEAQYIKNPRAKTARSLCAQPAQHRLALTGTPMENHLQELWSLFHFLMPGFLGSLEYFNRLYRRPIENQGDTQRQAILRARLAPYILRRRKLDVERELPPKSEILRLIPLNTAQQDLYETVRVAVDRSLSELLAKQGLQRSRIAVLDALLKLRQICCDPQLLSLPEAQKIKRSAKKDFLLQLLPELLSNGHRVLVFSQFVSMLEQLEKELQHAQIDYLKLTGRSRKRQPLIDRFQAGECPLFLISLKAGGVGLNLTAADTVIHYDPWWNPASEDQATDRAYRIGQDKPVFVYKLIAAGTVEEYIHNLQSQKRALLQGVLSGQNTDGELDALLNLLRPSG